MTKNGRLIASYFGSKPLFLGLYNDHQQVVYATPPGTMHLAHVTYLKPRAQSEYWRSGIDYFQVTDADKVLNLVANEPIFLREEEITQELLETEKRHGVRFRIHSSVEEPLERALTQAALTDIFLHTFNKTSPRIRSEPFSVYTDDIKSEARITYAGNATIDLEGKQSFYADCVLDLNLDFAHWCVASLRRDGKIAPWEDCDYCYSGYKHDGYPLIRKVTRKDLVKQINEARKIRTAQELPTRFLRLGKNTETGDDIFIDNLTATFEAALSTGLSIVMPTKHLRFYREIAELARRTHSSLLFSIGNDSLELGSVSRGFSNEQRFETAKRYLDYGVNTVPYVLVDGILESGGLLFKGNLAKALRLFPKVQLLPVRTRHKSSAHKILGAWNDVVGQQGQNLFGEHVGGYETARDHTRITHDVHSSLSALVKDNNSDVRMCHHNSNANYCGGCFMKGVCGAINPHKKVTVEKKVNRPHKGRLDKHTGKFGFMDTLEVVKG